MKFKHKLKLLQELPKKKCKYCGSKEDLTYDHKIPVILGGKDEMKNIQVLCKRCNQMKSGMTHKQIIRLFKWFKEISKIKTVN